MPKSNKNVQNVQESATNNTNETIAKVAPKVRKTAKVAKEKVAKVAQDAKDAIEQVSKNGKVKAVDLRRSFILVEVITKDDSKFKSDKEHKSKTPAGAARKVAHKACKELYGEDDYCTIDLTIQESTEGSAEKRYSYRATRTLKTKKVGFKVDNPKEGVELDEEGKAKIPFKFDMDLKTLKKNEDGVQVEVPVPAEKEDEETVNETTV